MKKSITKLSLLRVGSLWTIAILGIFSAPKNDLPLLSWCGMLIASKIVGLGAGYAAYRLTKRWDKMGTIPELTNEIKD